MTPDQIASHTRAIIAQRIGDEVLRAAEIEASNAALSAEVGRLQAALKEHEQAQSRAEEPAAD